MNQRLGAIQICHRKLVQQLKQGVPVWAIGIAKLGIFPELIARVAGVPIVKGIWEIVADGIKNGIVNYSPLMSCE